MYYGGGTKNDKQLLRTKNPSSLSVLNQYPSSLGIDMHRSTQNTPGPGTYNVTNGFDQINKDM